MPQPQSYKNHTRYDRGFHFWLIPASALLLIGAAVNAWRHPRSGMAYWLLAFIATFIWAVFKMRLYALRNQDRIIRLEETIRIQRVCPELAAKSGQLTTGQVVALRFCSDAELPVLTKRALDEKLSNADIKKSIKEWRGDYIRI
jgi:hypothetical protein